MTLLSSLRRLLTVPSSRRRPASAPPAACWLEALEDRTVPTAVAVPSGIVSWWTANNTAADAMGLNNATLSNGDLRDRRGRQGVQLQRVERLGGARRSQQPGVHGFVHHRRLDQGERAPHQLQLWQHHVPRRRPRRPGPVPARASSRTAICNSKSTRRDQGGGRRGGSHSDRAVRSRGRHAGRRDRGDDALRERGGRRADHDHRSAVRHPGPDAAARRRHRQLQRPVTTTTSPSTA